MQVRVRATDAGAIPKTSTTVVEVKVVRDEGELSFSQDTYTAETSENREVGATLTTVRASPGVSNIMAEMPKLIRWNDIILTWLIVLNKCSLRGDRYPGGASELSGTTHVFHPILCSFFKWVYCSEWTVICFQTDIQYEVVGTSNAPDYFMVEPNSGEVKIKADIRDDPSDVTF